MAQIRKVEIVKFTQEFEVAQHKERVWAFFEQPAAVAGCVPGVDSIAEVEPDIFTVHVTQSVGPFSATFEARLQIIEKIDGDRIAFKATGKSVRGAIGNFRAESLVTLHATGDSTKVRVESEAALAGVLGSVGQKVIARQAEKITAQFAASLEQRLKGEAPAESAGAAHAPAASRPVVPSPRVAHLSAPAAVSDAYAITQASSVGWMKIAAFVALANLAVTLVILGKLL
ncbi:CoxG family protein [Oceaniradius stylonematis]|uniref:CoxG family protein n=1 Tax=Oceaniradius stylonematis TaxID=2184161 RepID=UPI00273FCCA6|nr:SRPBCC domain-containing protein [Oceaniradius stylonematis]